MLGVATENIMFRSSVLQNCFLWVAICLVFTSSQVTPGIRKCWDCSSKGPHGVPNPLCPAHGDVHPRAYRGPCLGLCFTRTDQSDPALVYRGCSSGQWGLPDPLPSQGCFTWQSRSQLWCLCSTDGCNGVRIGQAGNGTLENYAQEQKEKGDNSGSGGGGGGGEGGGKNDNHSNDTSVLPPSFVSGGIQPEVLQCWQCLSHYQGVTYSQCPVDDQVEVSKAYIGNCTGQCFSYTFQDASGVKAIHRGCTSDQWGLPDPLPSQGCFTWQSRSQVWCFCATHGCNGAKMGDAGNITLEEFVEEQRRKNSEGQSPDTVLPPSMSTGQVPTEVLQCWECQSYYQGRYYDQCPLHERVDNRRVFIGNCTGRCFMHNAIDKASGVEVLHRGCSSSVYGLPDPLPADGCYSWHHQVWCLCNVTGCNGIRLGTPQKALDAHISNRGPFACAGSAFLIVAVILTYYVFD